MRALPHWGGVILSLDENGDPRWETNYGGLSKFTITESGSSDKWSIGTIDCSDFLETNEFATFCVETPGKINSANCTINGIVVRVNGAGIQEGFLDASAMYMCIYQRDENAIDVYDIEGMNMVAQNLGPNLLLKDTSVADIDVYSRVQLDRIVERVDVSVSGIQTLQGSIDEFSEDVQYKMNDYCKHEG